MGGWTYLGLFQGFSQYNHAIELLVKNVLQVLLLFFSLCFLHEADSLSPALRVHGIGHDHEVNQKAENQKAAHFLRR